MGIEQTQFIDLMMRRSYMRVVGYIATRVNVSYVKKPAGGYYYDDELLRPSKMGNMMFLRRSGDWVGIVPKAVWRDENLSVRLPGEGNFCWSWISRGEDAWLGVYSYYYKKVFFYPSFMWGRKKPGSVMSISRESLFSGKHDILETIMRDWVDKEKAFARLRRLGLE